MRDYYSQSGVRKSIIDFVYSGSPEPLREAAFYNESVDGIQRHSPDEDSVFVIESEKSLAGALREGATAFYASYWRYSDPHEASKPKGRDLVWSLSATDGGLGVSKKITSLFLKALEREGFSSPLVKYSGKLGFDIMIPLEDVQAGSPDDFDFISRIQSDLTDRATDYIERESFFEVQGDGSELKLTGEKGTCLLSELRWRRGLLLAPMSLHPSSGLVSVPLAPEEIPEFSVVEASPDKVHPQEWALKTALADDRPASVSSPTANRLSLKT